MPSKADTPNLLSEAARASETIMVICEDCEILRKVNAYQLLSEHGDISMPSLLDPIARSLKCPRVDNQYYDRCKLCYHFHPDVWARKMGYVKPNEGKESDPTLADLSEWQRLRATCRACGNSREIDRWAIQRRFGRELRLSEIALRLACRCGEKGQSAVTVTSAKRD